MFSGLVEELRGRIDPVKAQLFPFLVLLELSDESLKGQVLRGDRPQPVSFDVPLPALTCRRGMPLEKEPLGDLIGDLLVRDKLLDGYLLVALPPDAVHWRVLSWPFEDMPEEPLDALRQLDPDLRLPFSLWESTVDLQPLPPVAGQPARMMLTAAPTSMVDAWVDVFNMAGVRLERLVPAQACLFAALHNELAEVDDDVLVALLESREQGHLLLMMRAGLPVFERMLPLELEPLRLELERCVAFVQRHDRAARRLRVLVSGSTELPEGLEETLGVAAEPISPDPYGSLVLKGLAAQEGWS